VKIFAVNIAPDLPFQIPPAVVFPQKFLEPAEGFARGRKFCSIVRVPRLKVNTALYTSLVSLHSKREVNNYDLMDLTITAFYLVMIVEFFAHVL
jgi:hypothetical protein